MALTPSTMLELGTSAPPFALPDVTRGVTVALGDFADKSALLVMFICRHCPFVKHIQLDLARLGKDYVNSALAIVAISSNDAVNYPQDAPASLREMAQELGFTFPLLYDESQTVAHDYRAACTPDFFLFDGDRRLVYRGQWDDSRPGNDIPVTGTDIRQAITALLAGEQLNQFQKPSIGCNIKWKTQ